MSELARKICFMLIIATPVFYFFNGFASSLIFNFLCYFAGGLIVFEQGKEQRLPSQSVIGLFVMLCIYLGFQLTPLPPSWLKLLTPVTWDSYQTTIWVVAPDTWMPISIHRQATIYALLHIAAIGSLCIVVTGLLKNSSELNRVTLILALAVSIWASLSILCSAINIAGPERLKPWQLQVSIFRDILLAQGISFLPMLWAAYNATRPKVTKIPVMNQLRDFIRFPQSFPHIGFLAASTLMVFSAFLSMIPVAIAAVIIGWLIYRSFLSFRSNNKSSLTRHLRGLTVVFLLVLFVLISHHFSESLWSRGNSEISTITTEALWGVSWFGSGAGTHGDLYGQFFDERLLGTAVRGQGGLMELWHGCGLVGILLIVLSLAAFWLTQNQRSVEKQHSRTSENFLAAGLTCLVLQSIYFGTGNVGDWSALLTAIYLVAAITTGSYHIKRRGGETDSVRFVSRFSPLLAFGYATLAFVLFATCILLYAVPITSTWKFGNNQTFNISMDINDIAYEDRDKWLKRLEPWSLFYDKLPSQIGQLRFLQQRKNEAQEYLMAAFKRRPLHPANAINLAGALAHEKENDTATKLIHSPVVARYTPDAFIERVIIRLLNAPDNELSYKFVHVLFAQAPEKARRFMVFMEQAGWDYENIEKTLIDDPEVWLEYGAFLKSREQAEKAEHVYREVSDMCFRETCDIEVLLKIIEYFINTGQDSKALVIASEGKRLFPSSSDLRLLTANLYARLGHGTRVTSELSKALLLEPGNEDVKRNMNAWSSKNSN